MMTRAEIITASIHNGAMRRPRLFFVCLTSCVLGVVLTSGVALIALLSGPIGLELQQPFLSTSISRLVTVQMSASLSLVLFMVGLVLAVSWRAPGQRFSCPDAPPWLFWLGVIVAAVWANWAMLVDLPVLACIEPDTIGYLQPSALRSSGYMLILKALVAVTGDLKSIVPLQLNVLLVAFGTLGWAVRRTLHSQAAGLVVAVVPMLSSGLLILAPTVMTEAFFVALIGFHLAAVLCVFYRLNGLNLALVGLTLGLMIVVRPNGISFLVGLPLFVFFFKDRWRLVVSATLSPIVAIVLAQGLYHQQTFGFFGLHQFGGISMIGAAAPLITGDMPSDYPELAQDIERRFKGYYVDFPPFEDRAYPFEMAHVASLTAVGAIYYQALPAMRSSLNLPEPDVMVFEYEPRLNAIAMSLALSAIRNNPWGFAKIVTSNYIANWHRTLPIRVPMSMYYPRCLKMAQQVGAQYEAYFSQVTDLAQYQNVALSDAVAKVGAAGLRAIETPRLVVGVFQKTLGYLALVLSLGGLVAIFNYGRSDDVLYRALAYGALVLQSGYGLISIGNASFARYTVTFDPVVILVLAVSALMAVRYLFFAEKAFK